MDSDFEETFLLGFSITLLLVAIVAFICYAISNPYDALVAIAIAVALLVCLFLFWGVGYLFNKWFD